MKPLDGVRVLDFTRLQAGPWATVLLSDMGSDVIKIEELPRGERGRRLGTVFQNGESAYFTALNRNKRSLGLNLKRPEAKEIIYRLAAQSDVVIHNFRPGVMDRLGFGYETLVQYKPDIIYCSISGFGQSGPYRDRPSLDYIPIAMCGMMWQAGEADDPPIAPGAAIGDQSTAIHAALAIVAALVHKLRTGQGQEVQVNMLDAQIGLQAMEIQSYLMSGRLPRRRGALYSLNEVQQLFKASDDYFVLCEIMDESLWKNFCQAIERPDLAADPRFADMERRVENRSALAEILNQHFSTRTRAEWEEIFSTLDVIHGPVNSYREMVDDPQVQHNQMLVTLPHPRLGEVTVVASPVKMTVTPPAPQRTAPGFGEHTNEILRGLGYQERELDQLRELEIIS